MASAKATKKETENLPVPQESGAVGFGAQGAQEAEHSEGGAGTSTSRDDNLMPLLYVLQPLSPQLDEENASYLEGAKAGMIMLRNSPTPLVETCIFQPTNYWKEWVEWIPRESGGGLVARWVVPDHCATDEQAFTFLKSVAPDVTKRDNAFYRSNGNVVKFTRIFAGGIHIPGSPPQAYVIPLTSTGHTVARGLMSLINQKKRKDGRTYDSFAFGYMLRTVKRKNAKGTWWVLAPEDVRDKNGALAGRADPETYAWGKMLHD